MLKSHTLIDDYEFTEIKYELRPPLDTSGNRVEEIFNAWIWIDNPRQLNSYTTAAIKELILALRQASMDRSVVNVVLTAVGTEGAVDRIALPPTYPRDELTRCLDFEPVGIHRKSFGYENTSAVR